MKIVLLYLFWATFLVIGAALFLVYVSNVKNSSTQKLIAYIRSTHSITVALLLFGLGIAALLPIVVVSVFLQLPLIYTTIYSILLLSLAIIVLIKNRNAIFMYIAATSKRSKIDHLVILSAIFLLIDLYISIKNGGVVFGDANIELAHIHMYANSGLSFMDPIFKDNGIPLTIYFASVLHAIQAMIANALDVPVAFVWYWSHTLYKLVILLSIFALCWEVLLKKIRRHWAYIALIFLLIVYAPILSYPELHNQIAIGGIALFLVSLLIYIKTKNYLFMYATGILIATSHPLNAFMACIFLLLFIGGLILLKVIPFNKKLVLSMLPLCVILVVPIMLYLYYPHAIVDAGFNDTAMTGPQAKLQSFFGIMLNTDFLQHLNLNSVIFVGASTASLLAPRILNKYLRVLYVLLLAIIVLLTSSVQLLGLLGFVVLFVFAKNKAAKLLVLLLAVFLALFIYNPLLLTALHGKVPLWAYTRFYDFNVLNYVSIIFGLLGIMYYVLYILGWSRFEKRYCITVIGIYLLLGAYLLHTPSVYISYVSGPPRQYLERTNKDFMVGLTYIDDLAPWLDDQIVYSNDSLLMTQVPSSSLGAPLAMDNDANTHPAVFNKQRKQCAELITTNLDMQDFKAAGVTRIITHVDDAEFNNRLLSLPAISLVAQNIRYKVYSINTTDMSTITDSICNIPPIQKDGSLLNIIRL